MLRAIYYNFIKQGWQTIYGTCVTDEQLDKMNDEELEILAEEVAYNLSK